MTLCLKQKVFYVYYLFFTFPFSLVCTLHRTTNHECEQMWLQNYIVFKGAMVPVKFTLMYYISSRNMISSVTDRWYQVTCPCNVNLNCELAAANASEASLSSLIKKHPFSDGSTSSHVLALVAVVISLFGLLLPRRHLQFRLSTGAFVLRKSGSRFDLRWSNCSG